MPSLRNSDFAPPRHKRSHEPGLHPLSRLIEKIVDSLKHVREVFVRRVLHSLVTKGNSPINPLGEFDIGVIYLREGKFSTKVLLSDGY